MSTSFAGKQEQSEPSVSQGPRCIKFWRHVVAIALVLLCQEPSLYRNFQMLFGLWLGTFTMSIFVGMAVSLLGLLFFTAWFKERFWYAFLAAAWFFALFQLFGEWALPSIVRDIQYAEARRKPTLDRCKPPQVSIDISSFRKKPLHADVTSARSAGYADDDILKALMEKDKAGDSFDFRGAKIAGATSADILSCAVD